MRPGEQWISQNDREELSKHITACGLQISFFSRLKEQQIPVEFICSDEEAVESHAQRRNCMLMHHHIPDLLDKSMQKGTEQNSLRRLYVVNILL